MLSEENRRKIKMTGIYRHEPDANLRGTLYSTTLYHCCNWTFRPRETDSGIDMVDTFWSSGPFKIELTDDNIDEFDFVVDENDISLYTDAFSRLGEYSPDDIYRLALDSRGVPGRLYIRKGATKLRNKVIARVKEEIEKCERDLQCKKDELQRLLSSDSKYI